ncbi:hypothetical protein [Marinobacterium aestuariivivens]|uniref:Uncharacterized protein n=1 Tax=Marinobacterium aestuariivivens TaxID=1698799 RepID=A0ABW2A4M3_9GAMM
MDRQNCEAPELYRHGVGIKKLRRFEVARAQGWKALELPRGGFDVIEFWIENRVMIELLTPDMAKDYLAATRKFRGPA